MSATAAHVTPKRPPRPTSAGSRTAARVSGAAESVVQAIRPGSGNSLRAGRPSSASMNTPNGDRGLQVGLVFNPRRPPSVNSIMRRQARGFNFSLMDGGGDGSFYSKSGLGSIAGEEGAGGPPDFFQSVVKPFLVLKGTTTEDRTEVFLTWALDIARNLRLTMPPEAISASRRQRLHHEEAIIAENAAASLVARQLSDDGAIVAEDLSSFASVDPTPGTAGSASHPRQTVHMTYIPHEDHHRRIALLERKAFLHVMTRDANVNNIILAPTTESIRTSMGGGGGDSGARSSSFSLREAIPAVVRMRIFLRVALSCAAAASDELSDFDFRTTSAIDDEYPTSQRSHRRRLTDRHFSLSQQSDLDSTDEDNDDGAPRPLDAVLLTTAEVLLANFTRLGLHETDGSVVVSADPSMTDAHRTDVMLDILRLCDRISSDSNAERSFGILLGIVVQSLRVADAARGALSDDSIAKLVDYVDKQRYFYTMKADGASMNRELVELYDRLTEPFYRVVRQLRLLKSSIEEMSAISNNTTQDLMTPGQEGASTSSPHSTYLVLLDSLERFIYYRSAQRTYDPMWTKLFHLEMTSRERLLQVEREYYVQFSNHVRSKLPQHGFRNALSGELGYHVKDRERTVREEILQEEARKYAFLMRLLEARIIMPMENDPKQIANHLVPTTRPATTASLFDSVHHVGYSPQRPSSMLRSSSANAHRPGSGLSQQAPSHMPPSGQQATTPRQASRPPTGKQKFHEAQGQNQEWTQLRQQETIERMSIRQQEADGWFVLAMNRRLDLEKIAQTMRSGAVVVKQASPPRSRKAPTEVEIYNIHALLVETCFSVDTWDAESAAAWKRDELMRGEASQRRAISTDEGVLRDVDLVPVYQHTIADNLYAEALQRALQIRFAEIMEELQVAEGAVRASLVAEEAARFEFGVMLPYEAEAEHISFLLAALKIDIAEQENRGKLMLNEETALDMLKTLKDLDQKLHRELFQQSMYDAKVSRRKEEQQRLAQEAEAAALRLDEVTAQVEDAVRVERVLRRDLEMSFYVERRTMRLWLQRCIIATEEGAARKILLQLQQAANDQLVTDFLSDGIALLQHDLVVLDKDIESCVVPEDASVPSANHLLVVAKRSVSPPEDPVTLPSSQSTTQVADAEKNFQALLIAARRADLLLQQQRVKILRGAFRYHLSFFLSQDQQTAFALSDATVPPPEALSSLLLRPNTSSTIVPAQQLTSPFKRGGSASSTRTTGVELVVAAPSPPTAPRPLPHLDGIIGSIRTYSRPTSAARAAAAAASIHRGSRPGTASSSSATLPKQPFNLSERVTNFNRVYLSEGSKQRVNMAQL